MTHINMIINLKQHFMSAFFIIPSQVVQASIRGYLVYGA
jgi:hypothetical protein